MRKDCNGYLLCANSYDKPKNINRIYKKREEKKVKVLKAKKKNEKHTSMYACDNIHDTVETYNPL